MPNYRLYQGEEIFKLSEAKQEAIIEGLLYENDTVLLVAPPKMSKTVLAVQMACNLSSGTPFLDMCDIPKPCKVLYIATEMKDEELKDRFIRTSHKVKVNPNNLILICTKGTPFKFNTNSGRRSLSELVLRYKSNPPKVIFIDSVYKAFYGSLTRDDVVNEFLMEVDKMAGEFDSAVVMVHHTKKETYFNGETLEQTDADTYGSQFLLGAVDHVIRLEKIKKENCPLDRYIRCETQRSGSILSDIRVRLQEPDPLYFYNVDINEKEKVDVMALLIRKDMPMDIAEIVIKSGISRTKVYQVLKTLCNENKVVKMGKKTKMYEIKRG